jgi:DUF971 family protein
MNALPTKIERQSDEELLISWSDGMTRLYRADQLRSQCPCATCRENRTIAAPAAPLPDISAVESGPIRVVGMRPVGNYAFNIQFSDGHDTGIFLFERLRELGSPVED